MDLVNVLHMNAGDRECSYTNSSSLQKYVISKSEKVLPETLENYGANGFSECFKLADLGCSFGPNTFLLVANTLENVHKACQKNNLKAPDEFQVFLNDLPNNDFNAVFKMIPPFYTKLENGKALKKSLKCFICGVPGSFYTRIFPRKSLHFVHSSYGVHWLSKSSAQVPEKLLDSNKGNIYIAKASPPGVYEAYFNQYKSDFTTFLRMRSEEIKSEDTSGKFIAKTTRAVMEPLLASHFGNTFMEQIFERFAKHVTEHLSSGEKASYFNILVSLRMK